MKTEVSMKLDRYTARALVDANMMSLKDYVDRFGSLDEKDAGRADGLHVTRMRPASRPNRAQESTAAGERPYKVSESLVVRFHCH
jgi:hypothetical protein